MSNKELNIPFQKTSFGNLVLNERNKLENIFMTHKLLVNLLQSNNSLWECNSPSLSLTLSSFCLCLSFTSVAKICFIPAFIFISYTEIRLMGFEGKYFLHKWNFLLLVCGDFFFFLVNSQSK